MSFPSKEVREREKQKEKRKNHTGKGLEVKTYVGLSSKVMNCIKETEEQRGVWKRRLELDGKVS